MMGNDLVGNILRLVVLGHSGFVGKRVADYFAQAYPHLEIVGLSSRDIDLTDPGEGKRLSDYFDPRTAVIMCSGIKSNYGSNLDTYARNVAMALTVCRALAIQSVRRFIFFSSIAVYGVDTHDINITEETVVRPDTHYGLAKYDSECLLRLEFGPQAQDSLIVLRASTIYGPHEKIVAATPSGFLTTYATGGEVTLFGDGSELREFLFIEDVVRILDRLLNGSFTGVLNIGPGNGVSYQGALDAISRLLNRELHVKRRERTKPKVDKLYNTARLRAVIPQFTFTALEDGLGAILSTLTGQ